MPAIATRFAMALLLSAIGWTAFADPGTRFDRGLLWRVQRPGTAPSFLFGTMHSSDERVARVPPPVEEALAASRSFTLEMFSDDASRQVFGEAMELTGGATLEGLLGPELFARAAALMQESGIPPQVTDRLKPWGVLLNLTVDASRPGVTLDRELLHRAMLARKPVYQLESVDEQVSLFDDMPVDTQVALLRHAVERHGQAAALNADLTDAWMAGDLGRIWELNQRFLQRDGRITPHNAYFIERVIHGRSVVMVHRMGARLREGGAFVAVGALHLYGERGVLGLLEKEGWTVLPVEP